MTNPSTALVGVGPINVSGYRIRLDAEESHHQDGTWLSDVAAVRDFCKGILRPELLLDPAQVGLILGRSQ